MYQTNDNQINVLAYYFGRGETSRCYPKRIEVEGKQLDFLETGIRCLVKKGQNFIQIFNMSDGRSQYRISFEPEQGMWKLLSVRGEQ